MTKKIFLGMALVGLLAACTDDYKDWLTPSVVNQPETVSFGDGSISTVGVIDFNSVKDELVKVCNITPPTSTDASYTPIYTISLGENTYNINADGTMSAADLENYIISQYGRRPVEREVAATVSMWLSNGKTAVKSATSGEFHIKAIPQAPQISENYYIVGGPNDWYESAANKMLKFTHSGKDVYEDPIFSVVFDAAASGDTWFAFGDEEACDAIAGGDWSKLFGCVGGNSQATSGQLDYRYNMGKDNSFCVPAGAKKIKMVVNMLERTYEITQVNISENYYLIGGEKGWSEADALTQPFSHSNQNVFDDPVFTYVLKGGAERWFSFGDADALSAITKNNDWKQLYGYVDQQADKGKFARRCDMAGQPDNTFHVDGSAKFYRFSVNMLTLEYEITPLNFDPFIYFIGATEGWDNENLNRQRLALTDESGIYTGYLYCADPNGWGNEFKFQKVLKDWDSQVNPDMMTGGITGDFTAAGNGNFKANAGEGIYCVTLNMSNMSIHATKINYMGVTGDYCGWNEGAEMTWNATDYCYELTGVNVNANGWKFRANGPTDPNWTINLGGNMNDLTQDGSNLSAVGTTIKLYPTRKTSDKIYCTVE